MKNLAQFFLGLFLITIAIVSCSDNDDNIEDYSNYSITKDIILKNNWSVNNLKFNNQNYGNQFSGLKFTFSDDNQFFATNGVTTYNGTYKLYDSNSNSLD